MLATIPLHTMQTTSISKNTLNCIDKHCRGFMWGGGIKGKKMSLVNWKDVCKPKEHGGLNIRSLSDCNKAFLMNSLGKFIQIKRMHGFES